MRRVKWYKWKHEQSRQVRDGEGQDGWFHGFGSEGDNDSADTFAIIEDKDGNVHPIYAFNLWEFIDPPESGPSMSLTDYLLQKAMRRNAFSADCVKGWADEYDKVMLVANQRKGDERCGE